MKHCFVMIGWDKRMKHCFVMIGWDEEDGELHFPSWTDIKLGSFMVEWIRLLLIHMHV